MRRQEKQVVVSEIAEKISRAKSLFFADFTGLTVEQANELRRELQKSKIDYCVVKNTLAKKALESAAGYDKVVSSLRGPTAIAFGYDDPVSPAKIIRKFIEKHEKPTVKICVVENLVYDGSKLVELSKLPSRMELVASILGSLQAPIVGVINAVQAVAQDLVRVIGAIEEKKKSSA
ncbi:MAG: 50S ribosomal protein L10 [Bacteroidota bacterium]